ncbi:MAG: ankyrin repeat domain-containing protein [Candidatus Sericytochromatia bacterium]
MNILENYKKFLFPLSDVNKIKDKFHLINNNINFTFSHKIKSIYNENNLSDIYTPLMWSVSWNNNYDIIRLFLKNGANPNIPCIHNAKTSYCLHEIIKNQIRMLEQGLNPSIPEEDIRECNLEKYVTEEGVKLLVEHGAKVNVKDSYGRTPLDIAIEYNHKVVIDYLISVGAKKGSELSEEETYVYKTAPGEMQYHLVFWHEEYPPPEDEDIPDF